MKMRKMWLLVALQMLFATMLFVSCSNSDDDNGAGKGVVSTLSSTSVKTGASVEEQITVDFSDTPLSDTAVSDLKAGDDFSSYVTQTARASSSARAAATTVSDAAAKATVNGVTIVSVSEKKVVFKINFRTSSSDGVLVFNVTMPAKYVASGEAVSTTAKVYKVGNGLSMDTSAKTMTIPTDSEIVNKVFKITIDGSNSVWYVDFKNNKCYSGKSYSTSASLYDFTYSNGTLFLNRKSTGETTELVVRKDSSNVLYFAQAFKRIAGDGLYSSFSWTTGLPIKNNGTKYGDLMLEQIISFSEDGVWQANVRTSIKNASSEVLAYLKQYGYEDTCVYGAAGFYTNTKGLITGYGADSGSVSGNLVGTKIYDGNNILWGGEAKVYTGTLPGGKE